MTRINELSFMPRRDLIILLSLVLNCSAKGFVPDSLRFSGQVSAWVLYSHSSPLPVYIGGVYIPQLDYKINLKNDRQIDFEVSANINGNAGFSLMKDSSSSSGQLKTYRLWARYSSRQFELRLGLQKINFGSATILRPLMWFDQVDPRDPLKLTDGVWGVLGRYYFLNNTNIWIWCLYGNKDPKGWEISGTNSSFPEAGGRIQMPLSSGEVALSYHYRVADTRNRTVPMYQYSEVRESRIGFDIKLNLITGLWFEGSWVTHNKDLGYFTNEKLLNAGLDYTFNIGNGLYSVFEQLFAAGGKKAADFESNTSFSLLSFSYPVGISGRIVSIIYYDWRNKNAYSFLNFSKQFGNVALYLMGYWNPESYNIPEIVTGQNFYNGQGIRVMLVLNH